MIVLPYSKQSKQGGGWEEAGERERERVTKMKDLKGTTRQKTRF